MHKALTAAAAIALLAASPRAGAQNAAGESNFRELYQELVETNTTLSSGNCTLAAQRMAARLKAAGFADATGCASAAGCAGATGRAVASGRPPAR